MCLSQRLWRLIVAKTKAEIIAFLDSKVGTIAPHPGYPGLNGQCVTLTKALMEFLGVPNPYAARGDAINAGDTYIRQGLGSPGNGWLTIVVNRDMGYIGGVHYGHIWIDLQGEANYESNGARALYTTKNTRPITQGQQFINFDKWVAEGVDEMITKDDIGLLRIGHSEIGGWDLNQTHAGAYDKLFTDAWVGKPVKDFIWAQWTAGASYRNAKEALKRRVAELEAAIGGSKAEVLAAQKAVADANAKVAAETAKATEAGKKVLELEAQRRADEEAGKSWLRRIGILLGLIKEQVG